jgi:hypothetical protein
VTEVQIITFDGADIGWMQSAARDDALFLGQIFVDAAFHMWRDADGAAPR